MPIKGQQPKKSLKPNIFAIGQELQDSAASFAPGVRVELLSNSHAVIDGCRGIIEYSDCDIRLSADRLVLHFCGQGLQIQSFSRQNMVIRGRISALQFE